MPGPRAGPSRLANIWVSRNVFPGEGKGFSAMSVPRRRQSFGQRDMECFMGLRHAPSRVGPVMVTDRSHSRRWPEDGGTVLIQQCGMFLDTHERAARSEGLRDLLPLKRVCCVRVIGAHPLGWVATIIPRTHHEGDVIPSFIAPDSLELWRPASRVVGVCCSERPMGQPMAWMTVAHG